MLLNHLLSQRHIVSKRRFLHLFCFGAHVENAQDCTPALPPVRCLNRVPSEPSPTGSISTRTARNCPGFQLTLATPFLTPPAVDRFRAADWPPARYPAGTGSSAIRPSI